MGANAETHLSRHHRKVDIMAKKSMIQGPRPSTKHGRPGGPAGNNPPGSKGRPGSPAGNNRPGSKK